ncbi:uncharacterized protein LOC112599902 [Melanaphis sacchari]|uniref:uncharacterized protein LOC112599902 n=1 Tax=Melanaphis sacchari TaxID=742174 RepID=UPI000DC143BE|nr:uncharacterized protein LOC112599902 [Melanaphis sacchari]
MPSCFVCARSRTSLTKLQNITFHRFPADHKILEKCHFDQNLFIENKSYRTLSKTAVPNIIISRVKSAKAIFPEKKVCLATTSMPILDVKKSLVKVSTSRIDSETSDKELSQLDVAKSCFNENRSIQVSAKNIDCEGVSLLDTSLNTTVEDNVDPSFLATSSTIAVDDTPRRRCLKLGLNKLSRQISSKKKQVKTLQQALRRKEKKIASLKSIILQLKKENLINEDATDILLDSFGCDFNANRLNSIFDNIAVFMDPAHMVKLVRNAFGEKREFIDGDGKQIYFNLVEQLFLIQENEECHLANKLRKSHIFFFKQKMKVKLATQLLSQSVADALKFCKYNLSLQEFSDVDGTVRFIEMFNAAFDIMNSRSINCIGNKKAICKDNFQQVFEFTKLMTDYIRGLKIKDNGLFVPVLESNRKTGFLGFIVCLNSTLHLYSTFIDSDILDHIRMYTISQDHLELFFGSVRAMGGYNNNPSARQFQSAYKKLVVQSHNVKELVVDISKITLSTVKEVENSNECQDKLWPPEWSAAQ